MKIRYLHQSGFALEMGNVLLVFDCWKFPQAGQQEGGRGYLCKKDLEGYERVYIFVSHIHGDHFNRRIFEWADERVVYVLDRAVPAPPGICAKKLSSGESLYEGDMRVVAHPSTDLGVSFQVELYGKTIFHAGDLNCWHWAGENTPEEEREAREAFTQALLQIKPQMPRADVAFFPVDPRLGTLMDDGVQEFLHEISVGLLVPMHFGDELDAPKRFAQKMQGGKTRVWAPKFSGDMLEISC